MSVADALPSSVTCPICLKKSVAIDPNSGDVSVDGVALSVLRSISMVTYKKCANELQLDHRDLLTGIPSMSSDDVALRVSGRESRMVYPPKIYKGDPLQVILNLQTTSVKTQVRMVESRCSSKWRQDKWSRQAHPSNSYSSSLSHRKTGARNGVAFFQNLHKFTDKNYINIARRDPWDYALPPECLVYQGNGWLHVYLKGVVWSSSNGAKGVLGSYCGDDNFQHTVPGAVVSDPNAKEVDELLDGFAKQKEPLNRTQEQDDLLCKLVQDQVKARVKARVSPDMAIDS